MALLAKIAWRNIWRNPRRSGVLISALAVGVFSFLGGIAYIDGFSLQMVNAAIERQGGHIQVTGAGYHQNPTIRSYVDRKDEVEIGLSELPELRFAPQVRTPGMITSADQSAGTVIIGVDPDRERTVSSVPVSIVEGAYLPADGAGNDVVIGEALAHRLNVLLGERIVLMANDLDNEISAGAYRVIGLFRTNSTDYDKAHVYLHERHARDLVGYGDNQVSVFTVHLDVGQDVTEIAAQLRASLPREELEILTWRDRSPLLVMMSDFMNVANVILVIILFTAIAFTLANSFIMVIFERIHEIGIMAAGGVRPGQVRLMLYLEALFIVILGMLIGGVLAFALIAWWSSVGLDLTNFSEALHSFGVAAVLYPYVDWGHVTSGFAMIFVMVLLSVLYPAIKASRFKIVDAMHHV